MVEVTPLRLNDVDITGTSLSKIGRAKAGETVARANLPAMVGDSGAGGQSGLVPAPAAGDADRVLTGAGTYVDQTGGGAGGPTTPGVTTTGFLPKWGDNVGDSLDAGVAAPTGAIVGISDTQTLTNKSISGASNTVTALPTTALADGAVTYPKMQDVSATDRLLGRVSSGSGDVEEVVCTDLAQSLLDDTTQGAMQSTLGVDPAGTDNSTPVSLAGTPDYLTLAGQVLTRGPIDLATDVSGATPIANGGTGQTSQTAGMDALSPTTTKGDLLVDNGTSVVRRGVGTNGQILTADSAETDGVKWANPAGGGDALTSSPLSQFAATTSAQLAGVISDETGTGALVLATSPVLVTPALGTPSAAVLTNATGLPTAGLVDGAVTFAKMQAVSADVLLGNDASGTAVEQIACTAAGRALLDDANAGAQRTTLGLGTLAVESTAPIAQGGTGQTTATAAFTALSPTTTKGDLIVDNGTDPVRLAVGATNGHVLTVDSVEATGMKWAAVAGGGDALTSGHLGQFAATTSAQLRGVISDEVGVGKLVFADALDMVATANVRPLQWDKVAYSFHATPGRGSFDVVGQADRPMMDGIATYAPATGGGWIQLDSVGGHAGIITSLDTIQTRWSPTIQFSIKTPTSLTGCRFWFGIFQAIPDSTAPVANGAAFAIKSAAVCWDATVHSGSNFWRSHTSDGTDATVVTGSVAIATSTDYKIRPVITPASISFYINDTLIGAAHTTDLPNAGDELGIGMRGIGTFFWKRIDVIHD